MAGIETTAAAKIPGSLDEMTVGAPRSAREALQSGAITPGCAAAADRLRDGRSALDVIAALASFAALPVIVGSLSTLVDVRSRRPPRHPQLQLRRAARSRERSRHALPDPRLNLFFGNLSAFCWATRAPAIVTPTWTTTST